jgi:hypothetical protein
MSDLSYLIDEEHDLSLKNLSWVSEISNVTEAKYGLDFLPSKQWVYVTAITNVSSNNLGAGLSKAKSEQVTNLYQSFLDYLCFILRLMRLIFNDLFFLDGWLGRYPILSIIFVLVLSEDWKNASSLHFIRCGS